MQHAHSRDADPAVDRIPPVDIVGLRKSYGRHVAVEGVDLQVQAGEVVGFLGPNGAGKTTVLRVLTGALRANGGDVRVLGLPPFTRPKQVHRRLGYLPGDLRLPHHLTGAEFLDLCDQLRSPTASVERDRLVSALDLRLDVPLEALSKGNRQKLGVVQAFMSAPALLLLDEPSSGLDPLAQELLEAEVRRAALRGAAVLLSSHVLREVEQVADRVVLLREGRVVTSSRLDELRAAAPYDIELHAAGVGANQLRALEGAADVRHVGERWTLTLPARSIDDLVALLATSHVTDLRVLPADLESIFRRYYEGLVA